MVTKKRYDNRFKAQVSLEAIKEQRTVSEIANEYGVHPTQITQWKKIVLQELPDIFIKISESAEGIPIVDYSWG